MKRSQMKKLKSTILHLAAVYKKRGNGSTKLIKKRIKDENKFP